MQKIDFSEISTKEHAIRFIEISD